MSEWDDYFWKMETGQTFEQLTRFPTVRQVIDELKEEEKSPYPARYIADNQDEGRIVVYEHDRQQNTHILGTTGQGKSKKLEMDMSMDIHMLMDKTLNPRYQAPFLFIDSTRDVKGTTMGKVLKYAIKKGYEKVLIIDPSLMNHDDEELRYVVPINPLDYNAPAETMAAHIADTLRVLWKTGGFEDESIITHNIRFIVEALHRGGYTLAECEQMIFTSLAKQREQIINNENISWLTRRELQRIYKTCQDRHPDKAWSDVQPTLRRFGPFTHSSMKTIFGSKQGVDFKELIKGGWIILCNLDRTGTYDEPQQRLLGTAILNEVIRARERMSGDTIPFYIYIDEFSYYVTEKISHLLTMGRHLGIFVTLAHQWFGQIDMPKVRAAVKNGCKCKFLFWVPDDADVREMMKTMGYGGELGDREIAHVLSALKKQQAAIRINKQPPRICDMRTWPDIDAEVSDKQVTDFLKHLFKSNPRLYRPTKEVWGEITNRFVLSTNSAQPAPVKYRGKGKHESAKQVWSAGGANKQGTVGEQSVQPSKGEDKGSNQGGSVFDRIAHSDPVLRPEKKGRQKPALGRATSRKRNDNPTASE